MPSFHSRRIRIAGTRARPAPFTAVGLALTLAGGTVVSACSDGGPTEAEANDDLPLAIWQQGFESGVDGWYDAWTDGALGWCGSIVSVDAEARPAGPAASEGRRYAEVLGGTCNGYWSALGIPGGGPYAPGPDAALYSEDWPDGGYVSELDVYLDPAWSGAALGTLGLVLDPTPYPQAVLQLAATVMPRGYELGSPHPAPHWFASVEAVPDEAALTVLGHRIDEAGWYTFRFLFSEGEGAVEAAFELQDEAGSVRVRVDPLPAEALAGPARVPFGEALPLDAYGPGHLWFFDAPLDPTTFAPVPVAIDEHRVMGR